DSHLRTREGQHLHHPLTEERIVGAALRDRPLRYSGTGGHGVPPLQNAGIFVHNSVVIFVEVCNNTSKLAPLFNPDGPKKVL
ncbi:MAG TPA: hypothetical protein VEV42_02770, partial [Pyrinomonadaceae bacterium]|nr:hypothetical protein [Pyrinomonadaceae bacterium]